MVAPTFTFDEMPDSRTSSVQPASLVLKYVARGEPDDGLVGVYALSATATTAFTQIGTLFRQDLQLEPAGYGIYHVTVPYGPAKHQTGSYTFTFDTTGAVIKVKCAKQHVASYYASGVTGSSNPYKGVIGVTKTQEVEGADIVIPALKLTVTFRQPSGVVTIPFAKTLASVTGMTNTDSFLYHDPGELLFLGATGSDGSEAESEVSYQFLSSQNATGLTIGEIAGIAKNGHDYAWVEYMDAVDAASAVTRPKAVHVEMVYNSIGFADTFGWS